MLVLPCDCCGAVTAVTCCAPCKIPDKTLAYDYTFWTVNPPSPSVLISSGTIALTYSSTGPNPWESQWQGSVVCPDSVSRNVTLTCKLLVAGDPTLGTFINVNAPNGNTFYTGSYAAGDQSNFFRNTTNSPGPGSSTAYTCTPFYSRAIFYDNVDLVEYFDGTVYDPDPGTLNSCCPMSVAVFGCGGNNVPGASYGVWEDSGKQTPIASGTTDAFATFAWDNVFCPRGRYREVTHPRFVSLTGTKTFLAGPSNTDTLTTPAAGYHCITGCGIPAANTLHATHPVFGAITYTYSAGSWVGTKSYSYPGGVGGSTCAAKTVTITCTWDGATTYTESWKYDGSNCPDDAGGNTATVTWSGSVTACPPSLAATFSHTASGAVETNLYGTGAMANVITE